MRPTDLVAGNDRQPRRRGASLDLVEFGMADAADADRDPHLPPARFRNRAIDQAQRLFTVL